MFSPAATRQRVIMTFIRRNSQGWGQPLDFTQRRLRMGGTLGALALIALIGLLFANHGNVLGPANAPAVFLSLCVILLGVFAVAVLWSALPQFYLARTQPARRITGTVNAAICDAHELVPMARSTYHFITVRGADQRLRAFAVPPELHDQLCQVGKHVNFTVTPGIDHIESVGG